MSERRVLLDCAAFMDSPHAVSIDGARTADIRTIVQHFLEACYDDLGEAPRLLQNDHMELLLREVLPRHFGVRDPLAAVTEEVLDAYLAFLNEDQIVPAYYELRRALDEHAAAFRDAVAAGAAHADGIALTKKGTPFAHRGGKVGRNDPCPCGSGKKFKKCCRQIGGI